MQETMEETGHISSWLFFRLILTSSLKSDLLCSLWQLPVSRKGECYILRAVKVSNDILAAFDIFNRKTSITLQETFDRRRGRRVGRGERRDSIFREQRKGQVSV